MKTEACKILSNACGPPPSNNELSALQALVNDLYADAKPAHVVNDLIADRRREAENECSSSMPRHCSPFYFVNPATSRSLKPKAMADACISTVNLAEYRRLREQ